MQAAKRFSKIDLSLPANLAKWTDEYYGWEGELIEGTLSGTPP
jgi:hypothetical protein